MVLVYVATWKIRLELFHAIVKSCHLPQGISRVDDPVGNLEIYILGLKWETK